ncbi:fumarylacetoacetate hydrolase family protein [bacterium]|nr:fumarylacetoacetate hydrolase family protein [bacterium]
MEIQYRNSFIDLKPTKILAVARNYHEHAKEMGGAAPTEPKFFLKPPSSIIGNKGTIILPQQSKRVDHEVELAVVISQKCSKVSSQDALNFIMGYSIIIDVTARDLQNEAKKSGMPWTISKGFDTFTPIGPKIISANEIDPSNLNIWLKINGEFKQRGNTKDMIFSIDELISYISSIMTLEPMDIIATGTPEGVGPIAKGDLIEAGIDGIGALTLTTNYEK